MGHHFVPQYHLRRFAVPENPELIWMYDKKANQFTRAAISKVAQQTTFYEEETEKQLNEQVERFGNLVFDKLIAGQPIETRERISAAAYIATMYARVPKRRAEISDMVPSAAEKVLRDLTDAVQQWAEANTDREAVARKLEEVDTVSRAVRSNPLKGPVVDLIRSPWPSQRIISTIGAMTWRIGRAKSMSPFFLTSDNPVHFFRGLGIGTSKSELVFPISERVALYASWRGELSSTQFFDAPSALVKECNRRIIHGTERFVFSPRSELWIGKVASKDQPFFSEIPW
jgi:hypothetical protein